MVTVKTLTRKASHEMPHTKMPSNISTDIYAHTKNSNTENSHEKYAHGKIPTRKLPTRKFLIPTNAHKNDIFRKYTFSLITLWLIKLIDLPGNKQATLRINNCR